MGKMLDMGSVDDSPQGQGVDEAPDVFPVEITICFGN